MARYLARPLPQHSRNDDDDTEQDAPPASTALALDDAQWLAQHGLSPPVRKAAPSAYQDEDDQDAASAGPFATNEVWQCNWEAVSVFLTLQTQWRVGMGGATGLDYGAMAVGMRAAGVARRRQAQVESDVRVMERATLADWAAQRKAAKD